MLVQIVCASLCVAGIAWAAGKMSNMDPYMDEIFHIPQTELYCLGRYDEWDDKITTLPGLYLLSAMVHQAFVFFNISGPGCSVLYLRGVNIGLAACIPLLAYRCCKMLNHKDAFEKALVVSVYPFSMFFYFLYYTDTCSTVFLLLTYCLAGAYISSITQSKWLMKISIAFTLFLSASVSIIVRQTNAVWIMFITGTSILSRLEQQDLFKDESLSIAQFLKFAKTLLVNVVEILKVFWPLVLPVVAFIVFVICNGSIVVGDKEHHKAVVHLSMPFHVFVCSIVLYGPIELVYSLVRLARLFDPASAITFGKHYIIAILIFLLLGYSLVYSCLDHDFLLSDNRHYTFYIWSWFLSKTHVRVLLVPMYGVCLFTTITRLRDFRGPVWISIYLLALTITLVPTPLFEFRYFTPGAIFAYLNSKQAFAAFEKETSHSLLRSSWILSFVVNLLISMGMLWIFIYKPFLWVDGSTGRFMP